MIDRRTLFLGTAALPFTAPALAAAPVGTRFAVSFTPAQWQQKLGKDAYAVLREQATERPFTSPLKEEKRAGTFACRGCGQPLFSSAHKFESGTGWPSFWQPINKAAIGRTDFTLGPKGHFPYGLYSPHTDFILPNHHCSRQIES